MISPKEMTGVLKLIYGMNHDQLNQVVRTVKGSRKNQAIAIASQFIPGDRVKVNHRKAFGLGICTVEKMLTKNIVIKSADGRMMKASPELLEKV